MRMLVVFGGLPGVGKTSIASRVAQQAEAVFLRIDTIEQAIRDAGVLAGEIGPAGYCVAYELAATQLCLGHGVVVDGVNPLPVTRAAWRQVAARTGSALLEVEIVCGDPEEHRRRVERRRADIPNLRLPSWAAVQARDYAPWPEPHLVLDSAVLPVERAVEQVVEAVRRALGEV
ncbi:AAA family ATPase [Teichococcus vastitatis]|uniref:AAA family ATPase n=1 Tax=Teichococcus vastitatis TaxID=2307076 RepID=A0ABS9WBV9_9PROT|nr:AAA family ATPase [Pseudoroseomonas vastitatis]MCI0756779.1 AAA family ATPase [Pseudoroseomonas vastitatis]